MKRDGLCECGCGLSAPISPRNETARGYVAGQSRKFIFGHNTRQRSRGYRVEDRGYLTPCWVHQGKSTDPFGYVHININRKHRLAHRHAYEKVKGPIPAGLVVDHLCRVPRCINPDHLEAVTHAVNNQRRSVNVVDWEIVRLIRAHHHYWGAGVELARRFGIKPQVVSMIRTGRIWKEIA